MAINFGWTRQQWEAMPWYDQRMYLEELAWNDKLHLSSQEPEVSLDDFAAHGVQVRRE